jgi:hypothetical protein
MHGEKNINGTSWKHTDVHKQLKYMRMPQAIVRAHACAMRMQEHQYVNPKLQQAATYRLRATSP